MIGKTWLSHTPSCVSNVSSCPMELCLALIFLVELNPSLISFMMTATHKLRWDEQGVMPQTQVCHTFQRLYL